MPEFTGWLGPIVDPIPAPTVEPLTILRDDGGPLTCYLRGPRAIVNQREINCCVSCALATCLECLHTEYPQLSPLYHYAKATRRGEEDIPLLRGMEVSEGQNALGQYGICTQTRHDYPFQSPEAATPPSAKADEDAEGRVVQEMIPGPVRFFFHEVSLTIDPVNDMKQHLRQGRPVLVCIFTSDWWDALRAGHGAARMPLSATPTATRHAVACLGYSDLESAFVIQDSFGGNTGQGGQWWLPYQAFASVPSLVNFAMALGY